MTMTIKIIYLDMNQSNTMIINMQLINKKNVMVTTQSIIMLISQANRIMLISVIKLLHYTMEDKAHLIN